MDATTLGAVLAFAGVVSGSAVAYLGKRGENALTGYSSLTNDLQEERAELKAERVQWQAERAELAAQHAVDQAELARLRALIIQLGGQP